MDELSRTNCWICNKKIHKQAAICFYDGYCCNACYSQKSPYYNVVPRKETISNFSRHIDRRRSNKKLLKMFDPEEILNNSRFIYVDNIMNAFIVNPKNKPYDALLQTNPDVFFFNEVNSISSQIPGRGTEIKYYDSKNRILSDHSFDPQVYAIKYDFYLFIDFFDQHFEQIKIHINMNDAVDDDQPTLIDLADVKRLRVKKDSIHYSYSSYKDRTDNSIEVKNTDKYIKYEWMLSRLSGEMNNRLDKNNLFSLSYASPTVIDEACLRFLICCFIAKANSQMSIRKKALLDEVFYDVLSIDPRPEIKQKMLDIYRMDNINYKYLLAFLYRVEANVIASIILIAEEIAMADGDMTEDEIIRLNILRQYLTERTGKDYSKNYYRINKTRTIVCPGCSAYMKINDYNKMAECLYCGRRMPI